MISVAARRPWIAQPVEGCAVEPERPEVRERPRPPEDPLADPLDRLCDEHDLERRRDRARILHHVADELTHDREERGVDLLVAVDDLGCRAGIEPGEVEARLLEHPAIRQLFTREARVLAQLDDPRIVPVYYAGDDGGGPYYVMRLVEGLAVTAKNFVQSYFDGDKKDKLFTYQYPEEKMPLPENSLYRSLPQD